MEQQSINTLTGLREAVWDIICDEMPGTFPVAWIIERLPYGQRVRNVMDELVREGALQRANLRGWYIHENPYNNT